MGVVAEANIVEIPLLTDPYMQTLSVCGTLTGRVRGKKGSRIGPLFARSMGGVEPQYVAVFGEKRHLHVNLVRRPAKKPTSLNGLSAAHKILDRFAGASADVLVTGCFSIPLSKLPKGGLIRTGLREKKHEGVTVQQTGQILSLRNGPVDRIRWSMTEEKILKVDLMLEGDADVDSEYLNVPNRLMELAFRYLILEEMRDARDDKN